MYKVLTAAIAVASLATAAQAVTLINGSFEDGVEPGAFVTLAGGDVTSLTGWTVQPAGVDYIGSYWVASDGSRSLDMSALDGGQITQRLTGLVAGKTYTVGFDMSGNPTGGNATRRLTVSATGGLAETFSYAMSAGNSLTDMLWQRYSYSFIASSATQDLQFLSQERNPFGPALDNVTLSVVPEPAVWGLMIFGFGVTGLASRRRARASSFSA